MINITLYLAIALLVGLAAYEGTTWYFQRERTRRAIRRVMEG